MSASRLLVRSVVLLIAPVLSAVTAPDVLARQIEEISRAARGRVGAVALILESGESVAFHGDEHFPMQSVYKLPIGMAALQAVDDGALSLEQKALIRIGDVVPAGIYSPLRDRYPRGGVALPLRELLRLMVAESDGTASDVLLRVVGGPQTVDRYLRRRGIDGIVVATSEKEMARGEEVQYRNWATPRATVELLRRLQQGKGLAAPSRALLLQLMTEVTRGAHRIKGLLPAGMAVAHKTGTSGTSGGLTRATNDVGIVPLPGGRHLLLAVFVADSKADEATRESVIARIARAAWDRWSGPSR